MADTLPARKSTNFLLRAGDYVTLRGSGSAVVNLPSGIRQLTLAATDQVIGPFVTAGELFINAGATDVTFTLTQVNSGAAPATGGALGPYATTAALQTAYPAAGNAGKHASVGSTAPYVDYVSNGTAWIVSGNAVIAQRAALGPSAIRQISNFYAADGNASAPGKTYTLKIALPVRDAVAIRLVIASTVAASIAGVRAIASSSASPSEPYNNAGTWTAATFGGSSSGTLPSGSAALPSVTRSDWIPVVPVAPSDGGPRTIYHLRVFIPNTSTSAPVVGTGSGTNFTAWTDALNQEWICSVNVGDNVTTAISSYSAAGQGNPVISGVEYLANVQTEQIAVFGDSIDYGYKATPIGTSSPVITANARSTIARPISVANLAQGGANSNTYANLAEVLIPIYKPACAMYAAFSPNDGTPTATLIQNQKVNVGRFLAACRDNNVVPILRTSTPNTNGTNTASTYSAVVDDLVKGLDDYVRAVCASGAALLVDYSIIMSNAVTPGVARLWKAGYNDAAGSDGLHPSATGYAAGESDPTYGTTAALAQVF